ncbi:asparagine synthase-related protein [Paenibacillus mendelii]|uniref:asparagine synthase (glutamine-hydrolyzing) n=1 Tax=Paenibacillus mendelii TaxID=206163 RepID=A0ABV6JJG9_9BACL|nr:asparagine synthase-related protein [Paenibacillus mendelii]MCQ6558998.1 asparagine synthase-related protein [Paenibacillus mendelii]
MSAIAGIYHFNGEQVDAQLGRQLMDALHHFPADRIDTWHRDNIFFGCHAQWITNESVQEKLPYYDSDRRLAITADAIIDNRDELLERLHVEHSRRQETSDSEIILLAYQAWGDQSPKYLVGDFAFMIWDERQQLLFGARDFSGARTLYYHRNNEQLAFCTVMKPLFSLPHVTKQLNEAWLAEYIAITGMFEPPNCGITIYKQIEQLPPAHAITISRDQVKVTRYNSFANVSPLKLKSNADYEEAFRDVFQRAVTSRLRTSRQVGAYLSGGLDSGSVVSFAAKALQKDSRVLHTYSYVPEEDFVDWTPKYKLANERPNIQATVQHVGNIEPNYLSFQGRSPFSEMDDWLEIMETPYKSFENSFWLKGIYEKAQQQGIGILLNGQRGNYGISWGPALDYYMTLMRGMKWFRLIREVNQYSEKIGVDRARIYRVVSRKAFPILNRWRPVSEPYEFPQLVNPEFAKQTGIFERLHDRKFTGIGTTADLPSDPMEARKEHFERVHVWNISGARGAKLSLRYGVRGHDPTNDLRVVRYCLSLPMEQFVQKGVDRSLIRRSTEGYLPDQIRLNQRVRGIQAADLIHRMIPAWPAFVDELRCMSQDPRMQQIIHMPAIHDGIALVEQGPKSETAYNPKIKILMRSLIIYRFLQKNF